MMASSVSLRPPVPEESAAPRHVALALEPVLVPDLLHPTPARRIPGETTKLAIALAFAGGVSGGVLAEALDNASLTESTWDPESFATDLFLPQFVNLCLRVRIEGGNRKP
jgi:hypothetical protein